MAIAFTVGVAVNATVTITNCTTATVTNLPAGVTSSGATSGSNYVITFSGTPTTAGNGHIDIAASDACGATTTTANTTGNTGFDYTVAAAGSCTTPTIGTSLSPTSATVGTAYSATIVVNNATSGVSVTNLPGWLSASVSYSAPNATITLTGTPAAGDVTAGLALTVDATNNPGGCTSASATGLNGGTLSVAAAATPFTNDCCGGDLANPVMYQAYNPGDPAPALPFGAGCNAGFTVTVCNDPTAAWLAASIFGFNDVVSCLPTPRPPGGGGGPYYPGWLYVNAAKTHVACNTQGENVSGSCALSTCL